MRTFALCLSAALFGAACCFLTTAAARAELRFCNESPTNSQVMEGHYTHGSNDLVVRGTFDVPKGTCRSIVPGRLDARRYFIRVLSNGQAYGGNNQLCIYNLYHFTITNEDAPDFHCRGTILPSNIHMQGFQNESMHLADFMSVETNGEATLVFTQRKNYSFHFQLK